METFVTAFSVACPHRSIRNWPQQRGLPNPRSIPHQSSTPTQSSKLDGHANWSTKGSCPRHDRPSPPRKQRSKNCAIRPGVHQPFTRHRRKHPRQPTRKMFSNAFTKGSLSSTTSTPLSPQTEPAQCMTCSRTHIALNTGKSRAPKSAASAPTFGWATPAYQQLSAV